MQRRRTQRHPFERVATPYQLYAWSAPQIEHTIDAIRAEDSTFHFEQNTPRSRHRALMVHEVLVDSTKE